MKKLIVYLLILCIAFGCVLGTHCALIHDSATLLDGTGNDCPITETVLSGDPARLAGWQIDFTLYAGDHLQWDGTYHLGATGQCETSDSFSLAPVQRYELEYDLFRIDYNFSATYYNSTNTFSAYGYGPLLKYAKEHAGSTSDTVTVSLADVTQNYPFWLFLSQDFGDVGYLTSNLFYSNHGIAESFIEQDDNYIALQELFRFPVQPEDVATVTMDFGSNKIDFNVSIETTSYVKCYHMVTDKGIYLLPVYRSTDGSFLKTDHAQGDGIYFLPYKDYGHITVDDKERSAITADYQKAVNVCPLGENAQVCFAQFSEDDNTVTLVLLENDQYIVQVMDLSSGTTLRRIPVTAAVPTSAQAVIWLCDNTLSLRQGDTITVVDLSEQEKSLTIDASGLSIMTTDPCYTYDGHLVLKDGQAVFARPTGSDLMEVMAWDESGLLFHGKYDYAALYEPNGSPEPTLELLLTSVKPSKT